MSNEKENKEAVNALLAIGLGIATFAALSSWNKRRKFKEALQAALAQYGIVFISAELARGASNAPTWHVTIDHRSRGIERYFADFPPGTNPYSVDTLDSLINRLLEVTY